MNFNYEFMTDGNTYYVSEALIDFKLDGVSGNGVSEFGFNPKYYAIEKVTANLK